jgi:DNA-binding transcriptional LysR family regulator
MDAVRTLVANGLGYTLANIRPRAQLALDGRRLRRVPLSGDLPPVRIGIATLKQLKKTRLAEAFERHCAERVTPAHIPGMTAPEAPVRRKRR